MRITLKYKDSRVWRLIFPKNPKLHNDSISLNRLCWKPKQWKARNRLVVLKTPILDSVWKHAIPSMFIVFCWKFCHKDLSVDENFKKVGIAMPSRRRCCYKYSDESIEHLFMKNDMAVAVWDYFDGIFRVLICRSNIRHLISV